MRVSIKNLCLVPLLLAGLGVMPAGRVKAQTFTTLHHFSGYPGDGAHPFAGLILSGNTLYGTAYTGGSLGSGTVFAVNADGTGFTNLHHFAYSSDGASPYAGLILSGNTLYGTTYIGGSDGSGTIFAVNTNGTGFTKLHAFTGTVSGGANPYAGLILAGGTLYGTAGHAGSLDNGTVFAVSTNGTGFTTLHTFTGSNGANPNAGLILSGNTLYGTAANGGGSGNGMVFAITTNGTGFTNLYNFTAVAGPDSTNRDGANPHAGLLLAGNTLFGTAYAGGSAGHGTVFAVNTDGTGFTNLHTFTAGAAIFTNADDEIAYANSDGLNPNGGLILAGNTLYGTAIGGGSAGEGTVFAIHTDGSGFTNLHSFPEESAGTNSDGTNPNAGLILAGNILYGTANHGGGLGYGTVFALSLPVPPPIGITTAGNQFILSWPTNAAGFALQSITNLSAVNWSNVTSGITIVGTNYRFTNTINGKASFFRLKQ